MEIGALLRSKLRVHMPRQKKQPNSHLQDLADFRANLWNTLAVNAKTLTGLQVVKALRVISDDVYDAGIDAAYVTTKVRDARNLADAWDLTWLTALNIKLTQLKKSKFGSPARSPTMTGKKRRVGH
jgi:hypothetical protein